MAAEASRAVEDVEKLRKEIESLKKKAKRKEKRIEKSTGRMSTSDHSKAPLKDRNVNLDEEHAPVKPTLRVPETREEEQVATHPRQVQAHAEPPASGRDHRTRQMKVLVVGDTKCGKTSIIQRFAYVRNNFPPPPPPSSNSHCALARRTNSRKITKPPWGPTLHVRSCSGTSPPRSGEHHIITLRVLCSSHSMAVH